MTTKNQKHINNTLNTKPAINPEEEIRTRINFLKEFTLQAKTQGFVLGISGGQDSMLAGKLAQTAVDELNAETTNNPYQFLALRLPYGTQQDEDDAQKAINWINPTNTKTINIKPAVDAFATTYNTEQDTQNDKPLTDYAKGNVKARVRMLTQYAYASELNLLVVGTDHAAEAVSGFFSKYGDGGADILPLSGLNKRQGKELLKVLDAPVHIFEKVPTADLLDANQAQPDETELGITYDMLDDYLEGKDVPADAAEKIERRYQVTEHKRQVPVDPAAEWWK